MKTKLTSRAQDLKNDDPKTIPEIDAGKTQDSKVVENTDKVHDFFTYLKNQTPI